VGRPGELECLAQLVEGDYLLGDLRIDRLPGKHRYSAAGRRPTAATPSICPEPGASLDCAVDSPRLLIVYRLW
jgi:hypothetical protein